MDPKEILKSCVKLFINAPNLHAFFLTYNLHNDRVLYAFKIEKKKLYFNYLENTKFLQQNQIHIGGVKDAYNYIDQFVPNSISKISLNFHIQYKISAFSNQIEDTFFDYDVYTYPDSFYGCSESRIKTKVTLIGQILKAHQIFQIRTANINKQEELKKSQEVLNEKIEKVNVLKQTLHSIDQNQLNDRIISFIEYGRQNPKVYSIEPEQQPVSNVRLRRSARKKLDFNKNGFGQVDVNFLEEMEDLLKENLFKECRNDPKLNIELNKILQRAERHLTKLASFLPKNYNNDARFNEYLKMVDRNISTRSKDLNAQIKGLQLQIQQRKEMIKTILNRSRVATKDTLQTFKYLKFGKF